MIYQAAGVQKKYIVEPNNLSNFLSLSYYLRDRQFTISTLKEVDFLYLGQEEPIERGVLIRDSSLLAQTLDEIEEIKEFQFAPIDMEGIQDEILSLSTMNKDSITLQEFWLLPEKDSVLIFSKQTMGLYGRKDSSSVLYSVYNNFLKQLSIDSTDLETEELKVQQ